MPAGSTMTSCECPTSPLHQPGEHSARPKQKPRRRDGALVIKRACLEGVAGTAAGPPPQRRAAELVARRRPQKKPRQVAGLKLLLAYFQKGTSRLAEPSNKGIDSDGALASAASH